MQTLSSRTPERHSCKRPFIPAPGHACLKAWLDDCTPLNVELIFVGVDLRRRTREQRRNFCAALTSHLGEAHDELRDDIHGWRLRSLRPSPGGSAFGILCPSRLVMLWLIAPAPAPAFVVCEVIWAVSVTAIGAAVEVAIAEVAVAPTLIMCCLPAHGCYVAWHRSRLMLAAWDAAAARLVCKRRMSVCQSFSKLHPEFGVDMMRIAQAESSTCTSSTAC